MTAACSTVSWSDTGVQAEVTTRRASPSPYSTWAIDGSRKRSTCSTTPSSGESRRATSPGGRGSPSYTASTPSPTDRTVARTGTGERRPRNRPRCRNAVWATSSALSTAAERARRQAGGAVDGREPHGPVVRQGRRPGADGRLRRGHDPHEPVALDHREAGHPPRRTVVRVVVACPRRRRGRGRAGRRRRASKRHPWYAHSSSPSRQRPIDSGTLRCGHRSTSAAGRPAPSRNRTRGRPQTVRASGRRPTSDDRAATYHHRASAPGADAAAVVRPGELTRAGYRRPGRRGRP